MDKDMILKIILAVVGLLTASRVFKLVINRTKTIQKTRGDNSPIVGGNYTVKK